MSGEPMMQHGVGILCLLTWGSRPWGSAVLSSSSDCHQSWRVWGWTGNSRLELSAWLQAQRLELQILGSNLSSAIYRLCGLGKVI